MVNTSYILAITIQLLQADLGKDWMIVSFCDLTYTKIYNIGIYGLRRKLKYQTANP